MNTKCELNFKISDQDECVVEVTHLDKDGFDFFCVLYIALLQGNLSQSIEDSIALFLKENNRTVELENLPFALELIKESVSSKIPAEDDPVISPKNVLINIFNANGAKHG